MAKKVIESVQDERDARLYEFSFHLVPKMSQEDAVSAFTDIKNQITATGATLKNESAPALLNLAYQMDLTVDSVRSKYNQAYFAWIIFEATGNQINSLKEEFKHRTDVIRHLLITTKNDSPISSTEVAKFLSDESEEDSEESVGTEQNSNPQEVTEDSNVQKQDGDSSKDDADTEKKVDEAIDKLVDGE